LHQRHKWLDLKQFKDSGGSLRERVLEEFDDVTVLNDVGNRRVLQAKFNDVACVLKEFKLTRDTDKACFMVCSNVFRDLFVFFFIIIDQTRMKFES
jgi:hypothetical protein